MGDYINIDAARETEPVVPSADKEPVVPSADAVPVVPSADAEPPVPSADDTTIALDPDLPEE